MKRETDCYQSACSLSPWMLYGISSDEKRDWLVTDSLFCKSTFQKLFSACLFWVQGWDIVHWLIDFSQNKSLNVKIRLCSLSLCWILCQNCSFKWDPKWRYKSAWQHANISICSCFIGCLSTFMQHISFFFSFLLWIWAPQGAVTFV